MTMMTDDQATTTDMVLERTFDAPPDLVWRMWTEPDHFRAWYGPEGVEVSAVRMDVRVGGRRDVEMSAVDGGMRVWFTGEYREVVDHRRLVYTEAMTDADGNPQSSETEVVVELEDLDGRTRLVLTHVGLPADSHGATGWAMALDKLATALEATGGYAGRY
jgi:uncharacterized protein YndB with AHSA1/START domain